MKFCPECGEKLTEKLLERMARKVCKCGFIAGNSWLNVGAAVIVYNEHNEFGMLHAKGTDGERLLFPVSLYEPGKQLAEIAGCGAAEDAGCKIGRLRLKDIYVLDEDRSLWVIYKAAMRKSGGGTKKLQFFSSSNPPPSSKLKDSLTERIVRDILGKKAGKQTN